MIKSSAEMVAAANKEIVTISVKDAMELVGNEQTLFVDIRDVRELKTLGGIPGALHAPRGMLEFWVDSAGAYHRKEFSSGKNIIFFCAGAWRSALTTKSMQDMGLTNICHLEGGFEAWEKAGAPIDRRRPSENLDERPSKALQSLTKLHHSNRLARQVGFVLEIDKLKEIWRQTPLLDNSRKENDAEHSWQLAMMALVLFEYAPEQTDILRVLKMVLIHDIVEIDAGDSPAYTGVLKEDQHAAEAKAADRLFGLLPMELECEFRTLWDEFEDMKTPDALFARAMDRLQPFLHNYFTDGDMWIKHQIHADQVRERMAVVAEGSPKLHALITDLIEDSVRQGHLIAPSE